MSGVECRGGGLQLQMERGALLALVAAHSRKQLHMIENGDKPRNTPKTRKRGNAVRERRRTAEGNEVRNPRSGTVCGKRVGTVKTDHAGKDALHDGVSIWLLMVTNGY